MIGEDVLNILYLQWVEVTPQLCKFPGVNLLGLGIVGLVFRFIPRGTGNGFTGNFHFVLPIVGIDSLNELSEVRKHSGLVVVNQVVLDLFHEAVIPLSEECCLAPLNVCG